MLRQLGSDATVAVIAPAFPPDPEKTRSGIAYLQNRGFNVIEASSLDSSFGYLAGNDILRAKEINSLFENKQVDAIFCARGGWGTLRLLDRLDYKMIAENPKLLLGYSDITSLQLALWQKCRLPSLSGPMVAVEMGADIPQFTADHFWNQVSNPSDIYEIDMSRLENLEYLKGGQCNGTLLGGCLSLIAHQLGTPYTPDYMNAILFIEDVGEKPYKIDRYLAQLKQAGVFDRISALIVGTFIDCQDDTADSFTIKDLIGQYTDDKDFPVVYNFPYGHQATKISMPVGAKTTLDTVNNYLSFENIFLR